MPFEASFNNAERIVVGVMLAIGPVARRRDCEIVTIVALHIDAINAGDASGAA